MEVGIEFHVSLVYVCYDLGFVDWETREDTIEFILHNQQNF